MSKRLILSSFITASLLTLGIQGCTLDSSGSEVSPKEEDTVTDPDETPDSSAPGKDDDKNKDDDKTDKPDNPTHDPDQPKPDAPEDDPDDPEDDPDDPEDDPDDPDPDPETCTDPEGCDEPVPDPCTDPEGCDEPGPAPCTDPEGCDEPVPDPCTDPNGCDEPIPDPPEPLVGCADPANDGNPCGYPDVIPDCGSPVCKEGTCQLIPVAAGTACRKASGKCDVADTCDGISLTCEDIVLPKGTLCRAADGVCDVDEVCDGKNPVCPENKFKPAGTVCRTAAGSCDQAETCTGSEKKCPSDAMKEGCSCPAPDTANISGYKAASTPYPITATGFVLNDRNQWSTYETIMKNTGLQAVSVEALTMNRNMMTYDVSFYGIKKAYSWASGDSTCKYWGPEGLACSTHADKTLRIVSWRYNPKEYASDPNPAEASYEYDKGVRLSILDTTNTSAVTYRNVLLVEPDETVAFKPITKNPGGMAWVWPYLYVTDSDHGMRVFDLRTFYKVNSSDACKGLSGKQTIAGNTAYCAYGHEYVLPQVNAYFYPKAMIDSCKPKFSFITYDRGVDKTIISGEFMSNKNSESTCFYSRLLRWPVGSGGKLKTDAGNNVQATEAWHSGACNVQGAVSYMYNGKLYMMLNSSRSYGRLYIGAPSKTVGEAKSIASSKGYWGYMPQGIYVTTKNNAWVSTADHNDQPRLVYFVDVDKVFKQAGL